MLERDGEDALSVRADHQGHAPRRRREEHGVLDRDERTRETDLVAGEQSADDLERLGEPRYAPVEGKAERAELGLVPACADAEDESSARDLVDRRRGARQDPRRVERGRGHERPEPHPGRHRRERGELRPDVPGRALRLAAAAVEQMVAEPRGFEAALLDRERDRAHFRPANVPLDLRELDSYPQRQHRFSPVRTVVAFGDARQLAEHLRDGVDLVVREMLFEQFADRGDVFRRTLPRASRGPRP